MSIYLFFTDSRLGGKDTVVSFGDGTYQVLKAFDGNRIIYNFCNVITDEVVINYIYEYKEDKKKK